MKRVVVVGGGFTGLVTAYYLGRAGYQVDLYEASGHVGGLLSSERTPFGLVESAANGMIASDSVEELFRDLGVPILHPRGEYKKKRFIFRKGLRRWPLSFFETLGLAFRFLPKFLWAKSRLKPGPQESVWQWGSLHLGEAATRYLLAPALQGIYAGDITRMSAAAILGPMFSGKKRTRYRGTIAPVEGMGQLIQNLKTKVEAQGARIHLNTPYLCQDLSVPHIVCVSAAASSKVVAPVAPELAGTLAKIETLSLISATVFLENPRRKIEGFGCLVPDGFRIQSLGILSNTYIFDNRGPGYSETWILGGARSPELCQKSDQELLTLIQTDRGKLLGEEGKVSAFRIHRWPRALPHFTVEHNTSMEKLQLPRNLYLNGNYLGVIGLSKIVERTENLVKKLKEEGVWQNEA
jgi:oxygen-dependent protoporphyrinogen oxidase